MAYIAIYGWCMSLERLEQGVDWSKHIEKLEQDRLVALYFSGW